MAEFRRNHSRSFRSERCCGRLLLPEEWTKQVLTVLLVVLSAAPPAYSWGRKLKLSRQYRVGQMTVYETKMQTRATISSNPAGLKSFLPPVPTELTTHQQNTVTIRSLRPDGSAEVETRFDRFDFRSDIFSLLPANARQSVEQAQRELSGRMCGLSLTARYDRQGRLLEFEGADKVLEELDIPLREPLRQLFRLFLDQLGGNALYPDHPVKRGEEWKRSLAAPASDQYPFTLEGENTLRYAGKTKVGKVKAAEVDFCFNNVLTPSSETLRQNVPLALLESQGLALELRIDGQGSGRVLLALADGRVLQSRARIHQTLTARLKSIRGSRSPFVELVTLTIDADTTLEMDGSGR